MRMRRGEKGWEEERKEREGERGMAERGKGKEDRKRERGEGGVEEGGEGRGMTCVMNSAAGVTLAVRGII